MSYKLRTVNPIEVVDILATGVEYPITLVNAALIDLSSESGEEFKLAFASGETLIVGGERRGIPLFGGWGISDHEESNNITLRFAKIAGVIPDYIQIEVWERV